MRTPIKSVALLVAVLIIGAAGARADEDCPDPLIVDLQHDGLLLTPWNDTVSFDIDGNGSPKDITWTWQGALDGFLFVDLDRDGVASGGQEMFSSRFLPPGGYQAPSGFDALAQYDQPDLGGNRDGKISSDDSVWADLRIWVDADHDGKCATTEVSLPSDWGITEIQLDYQPLNQYDGANNLLVSRNFRAGLCGSSRPYSAEVWDVGFVWVTK